MYVRRLAPGLASAQCCFFHAENERAREPLRDFRGRVLGRSHPYTMNNSAPIVSDSLFFPGFPCPWPAWPNTDCATAAGTDATSPALRCGSRIQTAHARSPFYRECAWCTRMRLRMPSEVPRGQWLPQHAGVLPGPCVDRLSSTHAPARLSGASGCECAAWASAAPGSASSPERGNRIFARKCWLEFFKQDVFDKSIIYDESVEIDISNITDAVTHQSKNSRNGYVVLYLKLEIAVCIGARLLGIHELDDVHGKKHTLTFQG